MLKKIQIVNYKMCNFDIHFNTNTTFITGYGKTSLCQLLQSLKKILLTSSFIGDEFKNTLNVNSDCNKQSFLIQIENFQYQLELENSNMCKEQLICDDIKLYEYNGKDILLYKDSTIESIPCKIYTSYISNINHNYDNDLNVNKILKFKQLLSQMYFLSMSLNINNISKKDSNTILDLNASNFVDWFRFVSLDKLDIVELNLKLREVIHNFKQIKLQQIATNVKEMLIVFNNYTLSFDKLSTEQQAIIILYSLIYCDNTSCIFLDAPERYLSPYHISKWVDIVKQHSQQLILTTNYRQHILEYNEDITNTEIFDLNNVISLNDTISNNQH